ncbi:hypothetical protein RclHR1_05140011 [Rhizophagus clarus]|uniref:Uncharacterized protein n=1 Tax=Rhizophagus clarus TaxID=94130 RepID=A0A2Z6SDZ1_9GLOM|nr:hypothetical protein RclHR1_05140011 [Rhizophagus clarus]GES98578.1 hypothetical protein GLOIN_2v819585 [Rhizophagus clarus]
MFSFQEGFDDSSATRCANGVSAFNKSNDSLEEQKNNIDDMKNNMTKVLPTSTDEKDILSNEKIQQQNDKPLHESQDDDEARAFRSQFDEIKCVSRMLEYSKNNAYYRSQGPAGRVPSAPLQKRINNETGINSFHQRSHSHSTHSQQTNRQMLKHQRSISSIQGLSFNRNPSAMKFYPNHGWPSTPSTPSTPFTPYGSYGFDNTDDILSPLRLPMYHFDDSNSNDDALMKFRDLENCGGRYGFNNSRFADDWDDLSPGYPSTPLSNGPFTPLPLTPSNISPSTPFFAQPHSLMDDDELFEKAKILEEERILLQIQQRKLDNAIAAHNFRYFNSDSSLDETEAKYKSNCTTPPLIPTRAKTFPFANKITAPPPRFQNSQEPIGTPVRKSGYITPPSTTSTGNSNFSLSASAPNFSLFSNPPALSLNQQHHRMTPPDINVGLNGKLSPFNNYPLTPSNSPPRTNHNDGYFNLCSYTNSPSANNNIRVSNESNYYKPLTPSGYFRAPLYSTPVDEREEDSLFADKLNNRKDYENNFTNCSLYCG